MTAVARRMLVRILCPIFPSRYFPRDMEEFRSRRSPFPHRILDLDRIVYHIEDNGYHPTLHRDEENIVIISEAHRNDFIPSIHHAMTALNLQHAFLHKLHLLHQPPQRLKPARLALPSISPNGILYTCQAVHVDLRGTGAEIRLLVKRGGKLLAIPQQHRYVVQRHRSLRPEYRRGLLVRVLDWLVRDTQPSPGHGASRWRTHLGKHAVYILDDLLPICRLLLALHICQYRIQVHVLLNTPYPILDAPVPLPQASAAHRKQSRKGFRKEPCIK